MRVGSVFVLQFYRHGAYQHVGFHIVEHAGFPGQRNVLAVAIDTLVGFRESRQVAEVDGAAFAEIAGEEGMEFVEQFLAEDGVFRGAPVDGCHQFRAQGFEITALQAHQVDKTGVSLNLRAREK